VEARPPARRLQTQVRLDLVPRDAALLVRFCESRARFVQIDTILELFEQLDILDRDTATTPLSRRVSIMRSLA
jgi:hypothetical protein